MAHDSTEPAYFEVACSPDGSSFVIELVEEGKIAHARKIVSGEESGEVHVTGIVVRDVAPYNPKWPFHLKPESISFFEMAVEVCDASITYVAEHLAEVGGHFLPGARWCPWKSRVVREVHPTKGHRRHGGAQE